MAKLPAPRPTLIHCWRRSLAVAFWVLIAALAAVPARTMAQEAADAGFSPASGHARVIAQGVVPLPEGDAVWRTVRTRAAMPDQAVFEPHPLGFVVATDGPLLLVNRDSGEQMQLGTGEAALTRAGSNLQLASLSVQPVSFLSIELVPADAPPPPPETTVLQPGQPFPAPSGLHDVDLLIDTLGEGETFTIPDSGAKNVVLIIDGAAGVGRPGGEPVVLLAGEAASFSGELEVAPAPDGGATTTFVVAMIGPELPPVQPATATEVAAPTMAAQTSPQAGTGSITIQIYACPPGMTAETLNAAACAPITEDVDVTLSGAALAGPLTLGDAEANADRYTWSGLPFGDYVLAEAVLSTGYVSYVLSARDTSGSAETGFRVTLDAAQPDLTARIYNFAAA